MNYHPISFTADSILAIQAGRKTQTRRVIKTQPTRNHHIGYCYNETGFNGDGWFELTHYATVCRQIHCPWGKVRDRLWVKETWAYVNAIGGTGPGEKRYIYRATRPLTGCKWKSSRFMPRLASRITLEVTRLRVERVQKITDMDAIAEGVVLGCAPRYSLDPRKIYRDTWEKLNAKRGYSWDSNPWVWVREFKQIEEKENV